MFSTKFNLNKPFSRLVRKQKLETLDVVYQAQPFCDIISKNQNTYNLDTVYKAQSFIGTPNNYIKVNPVAGANHPDVNKWLIDVTINSGTVSANTISALNTFCYAIDNADLRSKFYRLNLFCGDNLASCVVPIYSAVSAYNIQYGYRIDLSYNFTNANYSEITGLRSVTTNGYIDTGVISAALAVNNLHFGIGLLATDTSSGVVTRTLIGLQDGTNNDALALDVATGSNCGLATFGQWNDCSYRFGDNGSSSSTVRLGAGNIVASWPNMYRNGSVTGGTATNYKNHISTSAKTIYVFALNLQGSASRFTDARLGWYSIGTSMSSSQIAQFNTIINTFYSAISRS